jgi:multiple sugar transport system substrate-binding protein
VAWLVHLRTLSSEAPTSGAISNIPATTCKGESGINQRSQEARAMARSKSFRSFLPILTALALLTAGCGPNADDDRGDAAGTPDGAAPSGSGATADLDASGEIFVYGYSYENGDEIATTRVDYFTEQFPDIDVTYSESTFAPQELLTALQGSDPPDVIRMPRNVIGSYIQRGVFEPIDSCLQRAGVDPAGYREAAIQQLTIDGILYALPEAYWARAWLIDNVLFEEAGLDPATVDWSDWDAIREANAQILDSTDAKVGIDAKVSDPLTADMFPLWVAANGGQLVADDGTPQLNSAEAVEALEFVASMIQPYGSHADFLDARGQTGDFFGAENQFALHLEGAFPMQQFYLNTLRQSPNIEITAAPFMTRDGEPITWADGDAIGIAAGSDNKDAACAFVTSVLSTDAWVAAAEARQAQAESEGLPNLGTVTGNTEADETIFSDIVDLSDYPVFEAAVNAYLSVQDAAFVIPPSPAAEEIQLAWATAVDSVLNGNADAQSALDQAQADAEAAVEQAGG